jgi:hypothetical protein
MLMLLNVAVALKFCIYALTTQGTALALSKRPALERASTWFAHRRRRRMKHWDRRSKGESG